MAKQLKHRNLVSGCSVYNTIYDLNTYDVEEIRPGYLVWDKTDQAWKYLDDNYVIHVLKEDDGSIGDVFGPDRSIDNAIVLFDGNTGKIIKDSGQSIPYVSRGGVLWNPVIQYQEGDIVGYGNNLYLCVQQPPVGEQPDVPGSVYWRMWVSSVILSRYEEIVMTDDQRDFDIGEELTDASVVYYNGGILHTSKYSGIGTNTLTLTFPTTFYDEIIVLKYKLT